MPWEYKCVRSFRLNVCLCARRKNAHNAHTYIHAYKIILYNSNSWFSYNNNNSVCVRDLSMKSWVTLMPKNCIFHPFHRHSKRIFAINKHTMVSAWYTYCTVDKIISRNSLSLSLFSSFASLKQVFMMTKRKYRF